MKRSNRILAIVICILTLAALSVPALAVGGSINSESNLIIQYRYENTPIVGAQFDVYRIADRSGEYSFALTDEFAASAVGIDCTNQDEWNDCALALQGYAEEKGIAPAASGETDQSGVAVINNLASGLYLVAGRNCTVDNTIYSSEAFIVALPELKADGSINCDVTASPKNIASEKTESISIHALKVWDDAGSEDKRPESITIRLLRNGQVFDTAVLSKDNNWSFTWENLDPECTWLVTEDVPEGYTVKTERIGDTFKLTNTMKGDTPAPTPTPSPTPTPPDKKLPQTGQLWWPVPVLLCAGLLCVALGIVRRKENG